MKPKEYITKLGNDIPKAADDYDLAYRQGVCDGARQMYDLIQKKRAEFREANREKIRKYNREYMRARRAKAKEMKEDIDKISEMK